MHTYFWGNLNENWAEKLGRGSLFLALIPIPSPKYCSTKLHCNSGDEAPRLTFPYITTSGSNILVMSSLLFVHGARFFFARQQRRVLCLSGYCDKVEQRQNSRKKWLMSTLKWHKSLLLLKLEVHRVIMSVLIPLLTSIWLEFFKNWPSFSFVRNYHNVQECRLTLAPPTTLTVKALGSLWSKQ